MCILPEGKSIVILNQDTDHELRVQTVQETNNSINFFYTSKQNKQL